MPESLYTVELLILTIIAIFVGVVWLIFRRF